MLMFADAMSEKFDMILSSLKINFAAGAAL